MICIVMSHYASHGGLVEDTILPLNHILGLVLKTGGKIGVIAFALISTYYLSQQEFKTASLLKLILQTVFYSLLICTLGTLFGIGVDGKTILKSTFCVVFGQYWFVTAYVGLYISQPILKKCTDQLNKEQSSRVLLIMFLTISVIPIIFGNPEFVVNNMICFNFLFFCGNHLRRYGEKISRKSIAGIFLLCIATIVIFSLGAEILSIQVLKKERPLEISYMLYDLNSPFMITAGMMLFLFFENMKPFYSKWINWIASSTFAVYLLHDNAYFKEFMWKSLLKTEMYHNQGFVPIMLHASVCCVSIFVVAIVIEFLRKAVEKMLFERMLKEWCSKIDKWYRMI